MKKLILFAVLLSSLTLHAQVDSAAQKVSFNLMKMDVCYLATVINLQSRDIEKQYDSLKKVFRTPAYYAQLKDSTVLHIDSVSISALLRVSLRLRAVERFFTGDVYDNFHKALRATGNTYLIGKLNEFDADDRLRVRDIMNRGEKQLMGLN